LADNTVLNSGSGGDTIASDDIAGIKYQRVKPSLGADGTATDAVPISAGMDTTGAAVQAVGIVGQLDDTSTTAVTENQFAPVRISTRRALLVEGVASGTAVPVSAASLPLPSGAATSALQTQPGVDIGDVTINNASGASAVNVQDGGNSLTVDGAVTVTNATAANLKAEVVGTGTFAVQDSEKLADNAGFTDGTTKLMPTGFIYDEVAGTALTENDIAAARVNVNRAQVGIIEDGSTRGRYATVSASNALKVDGSAVTQPVSIAASVTTVAAGDVAHDGADSGNPVKVGGKAVSSEPTAVSATGDRANFITDMVGKLITLPYANPENFVSGAITSAMTGTTSTSLVAAPGSGLRNYITTLIVSNSHATVGTDVIIQDGSGGTTLLTIPAAAVYGGAVINLPVPLRQPTANTALYCANVTTGASTKVSAVGYKGA
jgi:hypothetical protein